MDRIIGVTCPYCETVNDVRTDAQYSDSGLALCDVEIGGCDNYFAYQIQFQVIVKVAKVEFDNDANE